MRLCSRHYSIQLNARQEAEKTTTVEPRFNAPRDWGNWFVVSRARYIEHLHLTNFRENYQLCSL